jgi:hypothetical protein
MKKISLLVAILLLPVLAVADPTYDSGIAFTNSPDGNQPATGGKPAGQNASNLQSMIQLFLNNKDLQKQTGASTKPGMDAASQSAQDINVLKTFMQQSNDPNATALQSLNQTGGRGDQKIKYCLDYTNPAITPTPDPVKYAECQGVNELNKTPVHDYKARTGFSPNDAIFSAGSQVGQAKKGIADTPQSGLMALAGVGGTPGVSGQSCVTVNKISPAQTTQGQCARAAIPDSTPCNVTITPKVILEKFCSVPNNPALPVESFVSAASGGGELFSATYRVGPVQVEYTCGTPSLIDGSITTIIARISVPAGVFGSGPGNNGWGRMLSIEFTPGVTPPPPQGWTTGPLWSYAWQSCVAFGSGCNGNQVDYNYGISYDGPSDTVNVEALGSGDGVVGPNSISSCKPGTNFIPASNPYDVTTCSTDWSGNSVCSTATFYATKSRCETPSMSSAITTPPVVLMAAGTYYVDYNLVVTTTCPTGYVYYPGASGPYTKLAWGGTSSITCFNVTNGLCPNISGNSYVAVTPPFNPVGAANPPVFPSTYCTLQSAINDLHKYAPAPHYVGGAGVRERLIQTTVDTCAPLQAQAAAGPVAPGGSYLPATAVQDTCPANWNLTIASASFPTVCQFQPAAVAAIATMTYSCPNGGTLDPATKQCELQAPSYAAIASPLYTCPVGDTLQGATCPNGGVMNGQSCLYPAYKAAVASQSCLSGLTLVGNLCYTDPLLAQTITAANGTTVLNSIKVYSCNGTDVLNGSMCTPAPQTVMCDYQPPSVSSNPLNHYSCPTTNKTGSYLINYTIADNTVQLQSCIPFPVTKSASLQSRWCNAPYGYNATTDNCEYQMPDYAASFNTDCSANPGYTYNGAGTCYLVPPTYPAF